MPGGGLEVELLNQLIWRYLRRVKQGCLCSATDDQHAEFVYSDGGVALPTHRFGIQSVLDLLHLVGAGVKDFHRRQHLIGVAKTTVQVDSVVHVRDGVVYSCRRYLVLFAYQRNLEKSVEARIDYFDRSLVRGSKVLEDVESVIEHNRAHVYASVVVRQIPILFLVRRPLL